MGFEPKRPNGICKLQILNIREVQLAHYLKISVWVENKDCGALSTT
jgi:hypothetical protein